MTEHEATLQPQWWRKKPVKVEAVPVEQLLYQAARAWGELPVWIRDAYDAGQIMFLKHAVTITTLEGTMTGERHDWIIRGVQGELYPCKPDIFRETYEPA